MTQCFPGGTIVHYGDLGAVYERWHQGPVQYFVLDEGTELAVTRNHPIATHLGWKAAWEIQTGWYLLRMSAPDGEAIDAVFHDAGKASVTHALPGSPRDFHGDGDSGIVRAVSTGGVLPTDPWIASESVMPRVEMQAFYEALAVTTQPNKLGMSNWSQVRRQIPDIDKMWPQGQPLGEDAALGEAAARELPPPIVDHDRLSKALVGAPGTLSLRRVDQAWTGIAGAHVYNLSTGTGAYAANGVIVGNCG